ncbi:MAG: hypothetical protein PWP05_1007 [Thermovirga sp.]|jgi:hypothetical protein|nr:hypothetical protein [Thermovirga sp.]
MVTRGLKKASSYHDYVMLTTDSENVPLQGDNITVR